MFGLGKRKYFDYFILVIIFILSRLLFLFFTPFAYYDEEAKIGSIGHDIVFNKGLRIPFWGYLDSPHSGGSIFSGLLTIPFYYIFGDKYSALKMAALVFSFFTLVLWYRLLSSETERRKETIILSLIFFSFAVPHYVQKSVILVGNTVELMFFNILVISYFWKIKKNPDIIPISYFFLGMLCGFSFWIQFMSFYLFLAIILTLFITEKFKTVINHCVYLIIGFLLGALPLWIYNLQYRWAIFTADPRSQMYFSFNLSKLRNFLSVDLPASFHFLDIGNIKSQYLSFIVYVIFIVAVLMHSIKNLIHYIKQENQRPVQGRFNITLELFLILYIFVFVIVTSFTTFPVRSEEAYGWNSMNVHAEHYIVSLQLIIFALLILLNKYKNMVISLINIIVSTIFILGYISLFRELYHNDTLLKPMHSTEANTFECGFNFIRNPELFLIFKQKIPYGLQEDYMKGAKKSWGMTPQKIKKQIFEKVERLGSDYSYLYLKL